MVPALASGQGASNVRQVSRNRSQGGKAELDQEAGGTARKTTRR